MEETDCLQDRQRYPRQLVPKHEGVCKQKHGRPETLSSPFLLGKPVFFRNR
jgi:hypothetical protein